MIFDIDDIADGGMGFKFDIEKSLVGIEQDDCRLAEGVKIQGILTRMKKEIFLRGRAETRLWLTCSRCLSEVNFQIDTLLLGRFVPKTSEIAQDHELNNEEAETEYYTENKINIAHFVHDAILLDAPMVSLCKEDCKGLCANCGRNLNELICHCLKEELIDPRLEILTQLKDQL